MAGSSSMRKNTCSIGVVVMGCLKQKCKRNYARDYADLKAWSRTVNGVKLSGVAKPCEINCDDALRKRAKKNVGDNELDDGEFADTAEGLGGEERGLELAIVPTGGGGGGSAKKALACSDQ